MFDALNLDFYLNELSQISNILDILLVTLSIWGILMLVRGTRAVQVLRGLIFFALVLIFVDAFVELTAFRWVVAKILPALLVSIPVIFQPELRHGLARLGQTSRYTRLWRRTQEYPIIDTLAEACRRLSKRRHGALIVIERDTGLQEYIDTGVKIDSDISVPLLLNLFYKDADLHDGGVIIRNGRLMAAACVMPLSNSQMSERQMGLRHRAALGTSEVSDAIVLVVSEETGRIAIAHNGRILPKQPQAQLEAILQAFLQKTGL